MRDTTLHRATSLKFADEARAKAELSLRPLLGVELRITDWSSGALQHLWANAVFPWGAIHNLYPDADRLELAMWWGERLVGLGLCRTSAADALIVQVVEGDPDATCPGRGKRALVAFETAANYAQALGRSHLLVHPKNDELRNLYTTIYGFAASPPNLGSQYLWKKV